MRIQKIKQYVERLQSFKILSVLFPLKHLKTLREKQPKNATIDLSVASERPNIVYST